jgi:hypothetical protein
LFALLFVAVRLSGHSPRFDKEWQLLQIDRVPHCPGEHLRPFQSLLAVNLVRI